MTDEFYMQRCLELAQKAAGKTFPNPLVGAVIVHEGNIIGEGYHHKAGEPHAEINAIHSVKNKSLLPYSTIYVSLEPCAHFGKTPPCALKLKEIGFKKVVIGAMDPHEQVNGKGKKMLVDAGIEVRTGILRVECEDLNKRFFTYHANTRPFLVLKWAQSADGFLDQNFRPTAIGNHLTKQFVHQLRSEEHAILVGTTTALSDNPSLTTREINGRNPVRILLDFDLKVTSTNNIYNGDAETIVINAIKNEQFKNVQFVNLSRENFLETLMLKLHYLNIQSVLIEGGAATLQNFINAGLWDEAVIIKNESLILDNGTPAPILSADYFKKEKMRDNDVCFFKNY